MRRTTTPGLVWTLALASCVAAAGAPHVAPALSGADNEPSPAPVRASARAPGAAARMPVRFEENRGQIAGDVRFVARAGKTQLHLRDGVARLQVGKAFDVSLRAGASTVPVAGSPLETRTHYLVGAARSKWAHDVASFGRITYPSVFRGVDLVYHGDDGRLEYDFVLAPAADVARVAMNVEGAEVSLSDHGELVMAHPAHPDQSIRQPAPRVYQRRADGTEELVAGNYRILGPTTFGFEVGAYDPSRELVIDPVLSYGSYLGGTDDDFVSSVAVDAAGNTYVAGYTASPDFPTQNAMRGARSGPSDAFVAKINPAGTALVWATYLGGSDYDYAQSVALDAAGNVFVAGQTNSTDLPTQAALQASIAGDYDAFVTKLAPNGASLVYSTYLGGSASDGALGLSVDAAGNAHVLLSAYSSDITSANAAQPASGGDADGFLVKLTPAGARTFATYLGGTGVDFVQQLALDAAGNTYVTGQTYSTDFPTLNPLQAANAGGSDVTLTKYTSTGARVYSTYLGGTGYDFAEGVVVDAAGNVTLSGGTESADFPTKTAFQANLSGNADAFVTKVAANGASLVYSTYLGGTATDYGKRVALDAAGNVYVTGTTTSTDFPTKLPLQPANAGGSDVFVTKLTPSGTTLVYSTYLGGTGADDSPFGLALGASGTAFVVGQTASADFPTKNAYQATNAGGLRDGFLVKITTPLAMTPLNAAVPPRGTVAFEAVEGSAAGYVFTVSTNKSGATIGASTGAYVAGSKGSVVDVVQLKDSTNAFVTASVMVGDGVSLAPPSAAVQPTVVINFAVAGGSGDGFVWTLPTNGSGGVVTNDGRYSAGLTTGTKDVVKVVDALGNEATASITVGPQPPADAGPVADGGPTNDAGSKTDAGKDGGRGSAIDDEPGNAVDGSSDSSSCNVTSARSSGATPLFSAGAALAAILALVSRRRRTYFGERPSSPQQSR